MKKSFLFLCLCALTLGGCMSGASYNEQDFAQGGPDAPLYNERTSDFMQSDNQYANIFFLPINIFFIVSPIFILCFLHVSIILIASQ